MEKSIDNWWDGQKEKILASNMDGFRKHIDLGNMESAYNVYEYIDNAADIADLLSGNPGFKSVLTLSTVSLKALSNDLMKEAEKSDNPKMKEVALYVKQGAEKAEIVNEAVGKFSFISQLHGYAPSQFLTPFTAFPGSGEVRSLYLTGKLTLQQVHQMMVSGSWGNTISSKPSITALLKMLYIEFKENALPYAKAAAPIGRTVLGLLSLLFQGGAFLVKGAVSLVGAVGVGYVYALSIPVLGQALFLGTSLGSVYLLDNASVKGYTEERKAFQNAFAGLDFSLDEENVSMITAVIEQGKENYVRFNESKYIAEEDVWTLLMEKVSLEGWGGDTIKLALGWEKQRYDMRMAEIENSTLDSEQKRALLAEEKTKHLARINPLIAKVGGNSYDVSEADKIVAAIISLYIAEYVDEKISKGEYYDISTGEFVYKDALKQLFSEDFGNFFSDELGKYGWYEYIVSAIEADQFPALMLGDEIIPMLRNYLSGMSQLFDDQKMVEVFAALNQVGLLDGLEGEIISEWPDNAKLMAGWILLKAMTQNWDPENELFPVNQNLMEYLGEAFLVNPNDETEGAFMEAFSDVAYEALRGSLYTSEPFSIPLLDPSPDPVDVLNLGKGPIDKIMYNLHLLTEMIIQQPIQWTTGQATIEGTLSSNVDGKAGSSNVIISKTEDREDTKARAVAPLARRTRIDYWKMIKELNTSQKAQVMRDIGVNLATTQ